MKRAWSASLARVPVYAALVLMLTAVHLVPVSAQTTLVVHILDANQDGRDYLSEVVKPAFEAENPDIEIEFSWGDWSGRYEMLLTRYVSGIAPDVMQFGAEDLGFLLANDLIVPLDRLVAGWDGFDDYPAPVIADGEAYGSLWSIPYRLDVRTLTYRRDMFAASGLDPDKPPITWDEFREYARLLARHSGSEMTVAGMSFSHSNHWQYYAPFLFQAGGSIFNVDGTQPAFHEDAGQEALQFIVDMVHVDRSSSVLTHGGLGGGQAAMTYEGDWVLHQPASGERTVALEDVGVGPPLMHQEQTTIAHVNKWAIIDTGKDPELAWRWIEYVSRPDVMRAFAHATSHVPARLSVGQMAPWGEDPRWGVFYQAAQMATPLPGFVTGLSDIVYTHVAQALEAAVANEKPVRQALEEAAAAARIILAENARLQR